MLSRSVLTAVITLSAAAVTTVPLDAANAQKATVPAAGDRVRIKADRRATVYGSTRGTLVSMNADSVVVDANGDQLYFPVESVRGLHVSLGQRSRGAGMLRGLGRGVLIGGVGGAVVGAVTYEECRSQGIFDCMLAPSSRGQSAVIGGIAFGVLGGAIGGVVGLVSPGERWQRTQWSRGVAVRPDLNGGMTVSVSRVF